MNQPKYIMERSWLILILCVLQLLDLRPTSCKWGHLLDDRYSIISRSRAPNLLIGTRYLCLRLHRIILRGQRHARLFLFGNKNTRLMGTVKWTEWSFLRMKIYGYITFISLCTSLNNTRIHTHTNPRPPTIIRYLQNASMHPMHFTRSKSSRDEKISRIDVQQQCVRNYCIGNFAFGWIFFCTVPESQIYI